jgi:T4 RnlA family RNA ligase
MNDKQKDLYKNLMNISEPIRKSAFYYNDQDIDNDFCYRIFGYMLANEKDWLSNPYTLWCRGVMFLIEKKTQEPLELSSLPMQKFFNLNENSLSRYDDRIQNEEFFMTEKLDGSLMSTYIDILGNLKLKSKMSFKSEHCEKAMELLDSFEYQELKKALYDATQQGYTIDLEWTSPNNRIVLPYTDDKLTIISAQCRNTLANVNSYEIVQLRGLKHFAQKFTSEVLLTVRDEKNIEGYVIQFKDKCRVKIKSEHYCLLHKVKEKLNNPKNLYEICLKGAADDLLPLFKDDEHTTKQINNMVDIARSDLSDLKGSIEAFYFCNKGLDRKDYAMKAKMFLSRQEFGLAMGRYLTKEINYIKLLINLFNERNSLYKTFN